MFLGDIIQERERSLLEVNIYVIMDGTLTMQPLSAKCWDTQLEPLIPVAGKLR